MYNYNVIFNDHRYTQAHEPMNAYLYSKAKLDSLLS